MTELDSVAPKRNIDYFCTSVRMGMATAAALESAGRLRSAHVDLCVPPGRTARSLERIAGPRVKNRIVSDIPMSRIHVHPQLTLASRVRHMRSIAGRDTAVVDRLFARMCSSIARQCDAATVVGTQNCAIELFQGREYRIMEQVSHPPHYERAITAEESVRFPGWASDQAGPLSAWHYRIEQEWQQADLVWVPAPRIVGASQLYGADPAKFRVIPYPIAGRVPEAMPRQFSRRAALRVVFAGTVMLQKGVQYIFEAFAGRPDLPVEMHFFGHTKLTSLGLDRLSRIGTVHGPVPRSVLLDEFRRADVLLFPSLAEGSALVTLEATGLGLPVIATEESGAPTSAMTIPARDPQAIVTAIETLVDDPHLLEEMSTAGLAEAARRDYAAYKTAITESLKSHITA